MDSIRLDRELALPRDMIGLAMTNTAALAVPTFGRQVMFGTNPLAFAASADRERAFVLDMSTTIVTRGKIEVCDRDGEPLPLGWAVDKTGCPATAAAAILADMQDRRGGGILPLGGAGELLGGHKGYGSVQPRWRAGLGQNLCVAVRHRSRNRPDAARDPGMKTAASHGMLSPPCGKHRFAPLGTTASERTREQTVEPCRWPAFRLAP